MRYRAITAAELSDQGFDPEYVAGILSHVSPQVRAVRWDLARSSFAVEFEGTDGAFDELLASVKAKIGRRPRGADGKPIYARRAQRPPRGLGAWQELVRRGEAKDFGGGLVAYRGLFLKLVEQLDAALLAAARTLGATPIQLPELLPLDYLRRLGVFERQPHHVFFAAPLGPDPQRIEEISQLDGVGADHLATVAHCLSTSSCYPLYFTLEGSDFASPQFFTMVATCTRHEAKNARTFERLTQFRMRELVVIGDEIGVEQLSGIAADLFRLVMETFDLSGRVVTARDSFFLSNYATYGFMQIISGDKWEARIADLDGGGELAVGSFNRHREFFSRRCGFTCRGGSAVSACLGFGLERLAYAIICRLGFEAASVLERTRQFASAAHDAVRTREAPVS